MPLLFTPGDRWAYSLATDVLGAVIAAATGRSLENLASDLVLRPFGLDRTHFHLTDDALLVAAYADALPKPVRMGTHHEIPFGEGVLAFAPDRVLDPASYPSGGAVLVGTAEDFLTLVEALRTRRVPGLEARALDGLASIQTGTLTTMLPGWGWSLGWSVLSDPAITGTPQSPGTWLWGGVYGNSWFVDPKRGLSVVALTNTAVAGMLGRFPDAIRDAVYASLQKGN